MGKNLYREKMEQLKINEVETLNHRLIEQEVELFNLRSENATLKERLRLVKIAASDGEE